MKLARWQVVTIALGVFFGGVAWSFPPSEVPGGILVDAELQRCWR